jgi:predicted transposase YbfD/YdcC
VGRPVADLKDTVVTADALHTVKATAGFICEGGGEFALPVKENRKALFEALDALPWHQVAVAHPAAGRGHGRITTRTIQVLPAPGDLPFPHVSQAYLIERHVTALDGTPLSDVAALGVTTLTATRAGPARLAGLVRGHRAIESLHWLRDTLYREDQSQVRTRSGPWPRSGTSPSAPSAWPGGTTPPKPPAGPAGPWTGPSPSPDSPHGRETAVPAGARRPRACLLHSRRPGRPTRGDRRRLTSIPGERAEPGTLASSASLTRTDALTSLSLPE